MVQFKWAIGLMSGTSLDGIDAALIFTDGEEIKERGDSLTIALNDEIRNKIKNAMIGIGDIPKLEQEITHLHAEVVQELFNKSNIKPKDIKVIGFHGQTIFHNPQAGISQQIGDGSLLAHLTGINVVNDFRRKDIAGGGQGAPLVPLYHAAIIRDMNLPIAILNIGGIANITWVGRSEYVKKNILAHDIIAFDVGMGNALLNEWAHITYGKNYDKNGEMALAGTVNEDILATYMNDEYFSKDPPKSLDRNYFNLNLVNNLSAEDAAATLVAFTAKAAHQASKYFPAEPKKWLICGGGRHNPAIMNELRHRIGDIIYPIENIGLDGDAIEAEAFAFLAIRSIRNLPLTLPTTTGVRKAASGGAFYRA